MPWTINAPADLDRMVGWGVDGLITDYPDRLREVLRQRNLPLPKPVTRQEAVMPGSTGSQTSALR